MARWFHLLFLINLLAVPLVAVTPTPAEPVPPAVPVPAGDKPIDPLDELLKDLGLYGRSMTEAERADARRAAQARAIADISPGAPGYGYPGKIVPYVSDDATFLAHLKNFHLTAGNFIRHEVSTNFSEYAAIDYIKKHGSPPWTDSVPFLLFTPDAKQVKGKPVPMVIFIPGLGEIGPDLRRQFNQRTVFEKVTSAEFQARRPCYLLTVVPPEGCTSLDYGMPDNRPQPIISLLNDAVLNIIRAQRSPPVDTNRLYITGLSFGGGGAYAFSYSYPGRYAAFAPMSGMPMNVERVHPTHPGNWWHFYNEDFEGKHEGYVWEVKRIQQRVIEMGGEFRVSTYPDTGHNSWDKAWREDAVWDWMFSKTADGRPVTATGGGSRPTGKNEALPVLSKYPAPTCTASKPGADDATGPDRGADGLMATQYVSAEPAVKGDYWMAEYAKPVTGRCTFHLSMLFEERTVFPMGRVEVSGDGKTWTPVASASKGTCTCNVRNVRFLRLTVTSAKPAVLVVRELVIE